MPKSILHSRKAVSNIIGGVFLIIIIFLAFNAMIWYYTQQVQLNQQGRTLQQLQQQIRLERVQVLKVLITPGPPGLLNATLQNAGPIPVHIVDILITPRTGTLTHNIYSVNYYIDPGSTLTKVGYNLPLNLDPQKAYSITFITERGNGVAAVYNPILFSSGAFATFSNLGYLSVNFDQNSFQYTTPVQSTRTSAWTLPSSVCEKNVMWWITFVNHGVLPAYVLHWSVAQLWQLRSAGAGGTATDFYIVAGSSTYNNLVAYTDSPPPSGTQITIQPSPTGDWQTGGPAQVLQFSAATAGGGSGSAAKFDCALNNVFDFYIVVSYMYGGVQFNQLLPYAAAVVTS